MMVFNSRTVLALVMLALAPAPSNALAQATTAASASPTAVQCLMRTFLDATGTAQPITIYVPAREAGAYAAGGFVVSACGAMSLAAYRAEACRVSRLGNTAVQNRLTEILGARPKDLCASANRAAQVTASAAS
jgi:hypothetical protein